MFFCGYCIYGVVVYVVSFRFDCCVCAAFGCCGLVCCGLSCVWLLWFSVVSVSVPYC